MTRTGWIRWPGLLAFVAIVLLVAGFWFLLLDSLVKRFIERSGTSLVGAKVELDKAALSLNPLGLTLVRLQVTDPDAPMRNAVEIGRIAMTMDGLNLLRRKAIVEEMTLDGVRFGTPRTRSGAIRKRPLEPKPEPRSGDVIALPTLSVPDPKEVLEREELQSVKLVETMRTELAADRERWQKRVAELPDKQKLEQYKAELDRVQKTAKGGGKDVLSGVLGGAQAAQQAVALQKDAARDLDAIRAAKADLEQRLAQWRGRLEKARTAPEDDVRRLKAKYGLSGAGATNVTRLLFGAKLADVVDGLVRWEARLRPILQRVAEHRREAGAREAGAREAGAEVVKPIRGKGVDVRFPERLPLPDLLVRKAHASVELVAGTLKGQIRNITPDQHILGMPLTFDFAGEKLTQARAVTVAGTINRVNPAKPADHVAVTARDYALGATELLNSKDWAFHLERARVDADGTLTLEGGAIQGRVNAGFKDAMLKTSAPAGVVADALAGTLADVRAFQLHAEVKGTTADYAVTLASNLDDVVKDAITRRLGAQLVRFENELQAAITQKVSGPLQELQKSVGGLDTLTNELTARLNLGQDLLKPVKSAVPGLKLPF